MNIPVRLFFLKNEILNLNEALDILSKGSSVPTNLHALPPIGTIVQSPSSKGFPFEFYKVNQIFFMANKDIWIALTPA